MKRLQLALTVAVLAGATAGAGAQQPPRRLAALSVELEGNGGYTVVDLNTWVRPGNVTSSEQDLTGFFGRVFLANLGDVRVGLETGRQRLFKYEVEGAGLRDSLELNSWYGGFAIRLPEVRRFSFDFGMGMYKFPKSITSFNDSGLRLSTSIAAYYRLVSYRGVSLPIGARLSSILDDRAAVLPAALTAGVAFRPFRAARGR
jgi:hypothetical protein